MIINTQYFLYRPLQIPNAVEQPNIGSATPNNVAQLTAFIAEKEYDLLLSVLGYEQVTELYAQFDVNGDWIVDALQKWVDLVDGVGNWRGLRYEQGGRKISLIAYYVYFYFLADDASRYTTTGVVKADAANSTSVSPSDRQVQAWGKFLRMYGWYNTSFSQPAFFTNWNGLGMTWRGQNQDVNVVTLVDFLQDNSDVYNTSFITNYQPINSFNL